MAKQSKEKAVADFSAAVAKDLDGKLAVALPYLEILNVVVLIVQTLAKFCAEKTANKLATKIAKAMRHHDGGKVHPVIQRGEFFYLVKVRTHKNAISYRKEQLPIIPGMVTTVDILTGKKTVLDYILKPILKARQNALRER